MTSYEDLTNAELRKKLLEHGYDLPISINRDFLVKKLLSATRDKEKGSAGVGVREKEASGTSGGTSRRQTLGTSTPRAAAAAERDDETSIKAKKRLSLNTSVTPAPASQQQGSNATTKDNRRRSRSGSRDVEATRVVPPPPEPQAHTNNTQRRKSASPAVGNTTRKSTTESTGASRRSLPFAKINNTIVEEPSDSESGVEMEEAPSPPQRFLRHSTAGTSFAKAPTTTPLSSLSRRSIHDPPKYRDEELNVLVAGAGRTVGAKNTEERYNDYLKFFRGSGRGEELFGSGNRKPPARYSSKTYSESEDESEEEVEQASPSKFRKVFSSLNPLNHTPNLSSLKSWLPFRGKGEPQSPRSAPGFSSKYGTSARHNNGHSANSKPKPKGFFRGVFQRNGNSSTAKNEGTYDDSPMFSKILLGFVVILFGVIGACYYYQIIRGSTLSISGDKISVPSPGISPKIIARPAFIPICGTEGVSPLACIPKDIVKNSRSLFNHLKDELVQRAIWKGCGAEVDDKITLAAAKTLLYRLSDLNKPDVDSAFDGLLFLSVENPKWGLRVETADSTEVLNSLDASLLDVTQAKISAVGISPSFFCVLWSGLFTIVANAFIITCSIVVLFGLLTVFRYYQNYKKQAEKQMFDLIEEILALLHQHYEHANESGNPTFLAVNHIRDELVAPKDRESKLALWNKAVAYISEHESRIREEIQHISGEEYRVWRWIPSASSLASKRKSLSPSPQQSPAHLPNLTSPNTSVNQWQGQAFEMSDGGPNSIPVTPTTCLKIRQMFDSNMNLSKDQIALKAESAIREKCGDSKIIHVGVDASSPEGCVYVKCATKDDARNAYMSLHGWWYEGHLLSVKFLREERYNLRFPGSK